MRSMRALVPAVAMMLSAAPTPAVALPEGTKVQTWAQGLNFGVDMAWVKGTKKMEAFGEKREYLILETVISEMTSRVSFPVSRAYTTVVSETTLLELNRGFRKGSFCVV